MQTKSKLPGRKRTSSSVRLKRKIIVPRSNFSMKKKQSTHTSGFSTSRINSTPEPPFQPISTYNPEATLKKLTTIEKSPEEVRKSSNVRIKSGFYLSPKHVDLNPLSIKRNLDEHARLKIIQK